MKNIFLVIIFIFSFQLINAQVFMSKEENHKVELGVRVPHYFIFYKKDSAGEFYYYDYIIQPHLSYFPVHYWGIGISPDINLKKSNFSEIQKKYGISFFTKFYFPVKFTPKFFKRLDFFIEFNFQKNNYYFQDEVLTEFHEPQGVAGLGFAEPIVYENLSQTIFSIPFGIKYEVAGNLHFEISPVYVHDYSKNEEYLNIRLGLEYYFFSNRKNKETRVKNKNTDILNSFIVGSSYMYYKSDIYSVPSNRNYYFNFSLWNFNVATSLHENIFVGIQNFMIFSDNADNNKSTTSLTGFFSQFDLLKSKNKKRLFIDLSVNYGNLLFKFEDGPVLKKGMLYAGFGLGLDLPLNRISKHLFLDLAAYRYPMLTNSNLGYAFNQYVIGINYHFGKRVK